MKEKLKMVIKGELNQKIMKERFENMNEGKDESNYYEGKV